MHLDQYADVDEPSILDTLILSRARHSRILFQSPRTLSPPPMRQNDLISHPLYSLALSSDSTTPECTCLSSLLQLHRAAQVSLRFDLNTTTASPQPPNPIQMTSQGESPTSVDAPLDYITVDSYEWPKDPPRPKRPRLATEEQKRRHRADQKRFMQRKRARFETQRQEAALFELQVQYLEALREEKKLLDERRRLDALQQVQFAACMNGPSVSLPATPIRLDATNRCEPDNELDSHLVGLLFSL